MEVEAKIIHELLTWLEKAVPAREVLLEEDQQLSPAPASKAQHHAYYIRSMFDRVLFVNRAVRWGECTDRQFAKRLDSMEAYLVSCLGRVELDIQNNSHDDEWIRNGLTLLADVKRWVGQTRPMFGKNFLTSI